MSAPNQAEQILLDISKQFDAALTDGNSSKLKSLLADEAVLHQDGLTLGSDVHGSDAVSNYFQSYWKKYQFTHSVVAGAVHSNENSAFSFWQDKDVKLKDGSLDPETTVGIWYHNLNQDNKIKDTWFLRQMTKDEGREKLQKATGQNFPADPAQWSKSEQSSNHNLERCMAMDKAARAFNDIWKSGDPSSADDIMTEDVRIYDPVFGNVNDGVDTFKKMIEGYSKSWKNHDNKVRVACTHSDKAFIWWQSTGSPPDQSDKMETLYGINMLAFNSDCKICAVVGFRQPTRDESESIIKPGYRRD